MTTKKSRDFLDKELFVDRGIVTFRSLSRELGIHVNDAKNELQFYYDAMRNTDAPAVPTYLISGEVPALTVTISRHSGTQQSDSAMDLDLEFEEDRKETDVVHQSKVLLVDALALDEVKPQFSRIYSTHIYSLSPSRLGDAGLVCTPTFKVQNADAKGDAEFFTVVGKITGSHVKRRTGAVIQTAASSSKSTLDVPAKVASKPLTKAEPQATKGKVISLSTKEQASTTAPLPGAESKDRPKPSGKLDWSKAKTKEKEPVAKKTREEKKPKVEPESPIASGVVSSDAQKRRTKRKPPVHTDPESESELSSVKDKRSTAAGSSVKKGVVYSEDEDDGGDVRMPGQRRLKRKSTVTSDSEMSLRAMMDIDDEQVECVSRGGRVLPKREEEEESEEDEPEREMSQMTGPPATTEDDESDHTPVVLRRRKPRKVIPIGRSGLKKRRVVKSRTTTDAKGYMQTEDYSSYESVEEEDEETKPKGKGRREPKKAPESIDRGEVAKPKVVKEESVVKPKAKPPAKSKRKAPGRGGLLNFFGPERGKK